ncbi:MAG: hypothetical protein JRJ68_09250 [Deltaproteobacteria bacterium]|nr:hypothetical protein [Deltaproteobacteria bacterium]
MSPTGGRKPYTFVTGSEHHGKWKEIKEMPGHHSMQVTVELMVISFPTKATLL